MRSFTFDPMGLVFFVAVVLLMVGTIPFTPGWVGALLILSTIHITFSWPR